MTTALLVYSHAQQPAPAAGMWAEKAIGAEVQDLEPYTEYLQYQTHSYDNHGNQVREVIESSDGPVARLTYKENRPLTVEEDQAERARLQSLLDDPASFSRHIRNEAQSRKQAIELIRLLPAAMLFTYAPGQPQRPSHSGEIVLDLRPNPAWTPTGLASEALTGIEGRVWIDPAAAHLTHLEARTFRPVNLGFGIFAKLYPGGEVTMDEVHPAPERWIYSHFAERLTIRALMVKTYKENSDSEASNFTPVAAMTYRQAIQKLLALALPTK